MAQDPPRSARPLVSGLAVLGGLLVLVAGIVSFTNAVPGNLDDAFITLVYARHLAEGGGLHWNASDGPVDGFTSLLDVLLKASAHGASDDPLALARDLSLGAHVLAGLLALATTAALGRGSPRSLGAGVLVGLAVSLHPAPAHGASFLLESPLFVLLAVLAVALPLRDGLAGGIAMVVAWCVVLGLLCLVRPEGWALALGLALLHALGPGRRLDPRARLGPLLVVSLVLLITFAWHFVAFGSLLPNTFFAKSSASRIDEVAEGWAYVAGFGSSHGALGWLTLALPVAVALPLALRWGEPADRARHLPLAAAALASWLMVIVEGGDTYSGGRFLAVPTVLSLLACGHLAVRGPRWPRRIAWAGLGALVGLALVHQLGAFARGTPSSAIAASLDDYACERQAARMLAEVTPEGTVMQTDWQRLKFFEDELRVIDLHGLNDREIARLEVEGPVRYGKFSHAHALEVGAPVWIYGHRLGSEIPMAAVPMRLLLSDPATADRFVGYVAPKEVVEAMRRDYVPASLPVCDRFFNLLVRREHAAALAGRGVIVGDGEGGPFAGTPSP